MKQQLHFVRPLSRGIKHFALFLFSVTWLGLFSAHAQNAATVANYNFEDNTIDGWVVSTAANMSVAVNSSTSGAATPGYIRTGNYSLHLTSTQSSTTFTYSLAGGITYSGTTSTTNEYIHHASAATYYDYFICYLYASAITPAASTNSWVLGVYEVSDAGWNTSSGVGSGKSSASTSYTTVGVWQQFFCSLTTSTYTARVINPLLEKASKFTNDVWMDDGILYTSSQSAPDLVGPNAPTALSGSATGSTIGLSWTSNTDVLTGTVNGINQANAYTGVVNTIVLRATNVNQATLDAYAAPTLNNQGVYASGTNPGGPHTDVSGNWTIISTTTGPTATTYSDPGLANGYYRYAVILQDLAYNYSTAAVTTATTGDILVGTAVPVVTVTGTLTGFGNQVVNTTSTQQSISVSGSNLTANIVITPPTGFQISTTNGSGYSSSPITLTQSGGSVSATPIYVVYVPTTASGATSALTITSMSSGATTINTAVSGNAIAAEPTAHGTLTFGTVTPTTIVLNYAAAGSGGGSNFVIVAYPTTTPTYVPADGAAVTGVSSVYTTATDHSTGHIVYDGTGYGSGVVTVTGLTLGTTYNFAVYEYNVGTGTSQNYYATPATNAVATATPTISVTGTINGFGNQVINTPSSQQSISVSGTNLTNNIVITPPAGFQISQTSGSGYSTAAITLTQSGGSVSATPIYVIYQPTVANGPTSGLTISTTSTNATPITTAVSGNAIAAEPTAVGTLTFGTVGVNTIVLNYTAASSGGGSNRIIVAYTAAPGFVPTDGTTVSGEGTTPATYASGTNQTGNGYVVYDGTGSGANLVTVSGLTSATPYYFVVYEYNTGTGTSQNYLTSTTASNNITTATAGSPLITTGGTFSGTFGNTISGANSTEQSFTVSGSSLTADIFVTPPTDFMLSTTTGGPYSSSVIDLPQTSGSVATTTIYAVYAPASAIGAESGNITCTSSGATTVNEPVTGNSIAVAPTAKGTLYSTSTFSNSIVLNYTPAVSGGGTNRIIVAYPATAPTYVPANGAAVTGVNSIYTSATDHSTGHIVYDGTGSGTGVVTVTGLTTGIAYHFAVYEYNIGTGTSQDYYTTPATATITATCNATPTIAVTPTTLTFSTTQAIGTTSAEQTFTVNSSTLAENVVVTAPTGFKVATVTGGPYSSSVTLTQSGGNVSATIYAVYAPTTGGASSGNITVTSCATTQNVAVTGSATGDYYLLSSALYTGSAGTSPYTDPSVIGNWTTDATGQTSVNAPTSFSSNGQIFHLTNVNATTYAQQNSINLGSAVGSKFILESASLTGQGASGHSFVGNIDILGSLINPLTLTLSSSSSAPVFGTINAGSTVVYASAVGAGIVPSTISPFYNLSTAQSLATPSSSSLVVTNNLSFTSSGKVITVGTGGSLTIGGTITASGSPNIDAYTNTGTTVTFNGTTAQTVSAGMFKNSKFDALVINNPAGVTFTTTPYTVQNSLTLTSGALNATGLIVGVTATTSNINVAGGTLTNNPATYSGTVNVSTSGTLSSGREITPVAGTIGSLAVSSGSYTLTSAPSVTVTSLSVPAGDTLNAGTYSSTLSATGATINGVYIHANTNGFSGGTSTSIKSTNNPVITLGANSTIIYNGTGTPAVTPATYGNLTVSNAAALSGATTVSGTLTLGGKLTLGSNTLTIADFSGSATNSLITTTTSTLTTTGALTGTLYFDATYDTLGTFNIGGNATLGDTVRMAAGVTPGTVTVTAGTLTTGGFLQLLSDINGTARIAPLTGTVSGNVNIQRYIPAQRGYRFIGHPYTTGNEPTIATLGHYFDITGIAGGNLGPNAPTSVCPSGSPSTYTYTPGTSPSYNGITSSTTIIPAAQASKSIANGILAFVRGGTGGVGCSSAAYTVTPATAVTAGPVNQGNTITETVVAGGYNIISNPFPSQIIISGITNYNASGISFIDVNPGVQAGNAYTNGTSYGVAASSTVIPINGAVIAYNASGSDVTFTFTESGSKVATTPTAGLLKTTNAYPSVELSVYNGNNFWDSWSLMLQHGTSQLSGDIGDIPKFSNTMFDIYSLSQNNTSLYRDARDADSIADGDVITLGLRSVPQATYTLQVTRNDLPAGKTAYLHDKYTNTYVQVTNGVSYPFTISADVASQGQNRMELIFNENNSTTGIGNIANRTTGIMIVPNPATSNINISYGNVYSGAKTISLINVVGQVVSTVATAEQTITIPVDNLANGVYMVKTIVNGKTITERFIKN